MEAGTNSWPPRLLAVTAAVAFVALALMEVYLSSPRVVAP